MRQPPGPEEIKRPSHKMEIFKSWCKGCGICTAFCPKGALKRGADGSPYLADPEACIGCRLCELRCPDFAIALKEIEKDGREKRKKQTGPLAG